MYKSLLVGLMAMVMGTGCMKVTYSTGLPASGAGSKEKQVFLLWGLVGDATINVNQICPQGVAWYQSRNEIVDSCVAGLTAGIVAPRTYEVRCSSGSAYLLTPHEDMGYTSVEEIAVADMTTLPETNEVTR